MKKIILILLILCSPICLLAQDESLTYTIEETGDTYCSITWVTVTDYSKYSNRVLKYKHVSCEKGYPRTTYHYYYLVKGSQESPISKGLFDQKLNEAKEYKKNH